jgi:hypothetical protein
VQRAILDPPAPTGAKGIGFKFEQAVFNMTGRNIASLAAPIQLVHGDYRVRVR